jgi:hypothetical protein
MASEIAAEMSKPGQQLCDCPARLGSNGNGDARHSQSRHGARERVVPDDADVLPPGLFGSMYNAFPHLFLSFSAIFLGLMQAAYDGALAYLTGRMPGAPIPHTEIAAKGHAIAEMLFAIESARALLPSNLRTADRVRLRTGRPFAQYTKRPMPAAGGGVRRALTRRVRKEGERPQQPEDRSPKDKARRTGSRRAESVVCIWHARTTSNRWRPSPGCYEMIGADRIPIRQPRSPPPRSCRAADHLSSRGAARATRTEYRAVTVALRNAPRLKCPCSYNPAAARSRLC